MNNKILNTYYTKKGIYDEYVITEAEYEGFNWFSWEDEGGDIVEIHFVPRVPTGGKTMFSTKELIEVWEDFLAVCKSL